MSPPKRTNRITKKAVKKRQNRVTKKFDRSDDSSRVNTDSDEVFSHIAIPAKQQSRKRKRSCSSYENLDQMECTSVSSIDLPPPSKRRRKASVKRKPMALKRSDTSSDSANYSVDSIHIAPKKIRGRPKTTSKKSPTKRKAPVKKRLPLKRAGGPLHTKKKAIPLQSEPTKEPSHQPTNPPLKTCQPEENQPITKTITEPPRAKIITESPKDKADRLQKAAKTTLERKLRFRPCNLAIQNDSTLSDEPVPTLLMDNAVLSVEFPIPEKDQFQKTDEEMPKKPEVRNQNLAEDEETTQMSSLAVPLDKKI